MSLAHLAGRPVTEGAMSTPADALVIPALAALVLRQARSAMIEGRLIAGVDRLHGNPIGLTAEDRRAMALVSQVLLRAGRADDGAEIHVLLHRCTRPLGEWLPLQALADRGLSHTTLISGDEGAPTPEAIDLAGDYRGQTANLEEMLFSRMMDELTKLPAALADRYYTAVREFVVRNPLATEDSISAFAQDQMLPTTLWQLVRHKFYEPTPATWGEQGAVPCCGHCGNALRRELNRQWICRTSACARAVPLSVSPTPRAQSGLLRVVRGLRQFWIEPGIDEIHLFDELIANGHVARLYPHRDRVDIDVGDVGIDLKSYTSPELLGNKLRRSIGGLEYYQRQFLVIPDSLVSLIPGYLDRLRAALEGAAPRLRVLPVSKVRRELGHA